MGKITKNSNNPKSVISSASKKELVVAIKLKSNKNSNDLGCSERALVSEGFVITALFSAIHAQREEITACLNSLLEKKQKEVENNIKAKKIDSDSKSQRTVVYKIQIPNFSDLPANLKLAISKLKAGAKDAHDVTTFGFFIQASTESMRAQNAAKARSFKSAFQHYVSAERSIGAAMALTSNDQITSMTASIKAQIRHSESEEMGIVIERYWKENIEPTMSAPKAANEMIGMSQFCWNNGGEVSHKFIAGRIRALKRKAKAEIA